MDLIKVVYFFIVCFCYVTNLSCENIVSQNYKQNSQNKKTKYSVFEASSEWKPLRKDEAVPRGTHVRLNLQTGEREAKLLDKSEETSNQLHALAAEDRKENDDRDNLEVESRISVESIKSYLQKLESDSSSSSDEDAEKVKRRFRSYDELKEELSQVNQMVKTDAEILIELTSVYRKVADGNSDKSSQSHLNLNNYQQVKSYYDNRDAINKEDGQNEVLLSLLKNMEYLVHQIDNAREFVKIGLKEVAFPSLNSSSVKIRYEATKLLGAALQNNPPAQVLALESDTLAHLLRTLAVDQSIVVKSGSVFALSCLLRRFPSAQRLFLERGGLATLASQFNHQSPTTDEIKLHMKIIALLNDLLEEKYDAFKILEENKLNGKQDVIAQERYNQYRKVNFEDALKDGGWCQIIVSFTSMPVISPVRDESDDIILSIMSYMSDHCNEFWISHSTQILTWLAKQSTASDNYNPIEEGKNDDNIPEDLINKAERLRRIESLASSVYSVLRMDEDDKQHDEL